MSIENIPRAIAIFERVLSGVSLQECGAEFGITRSRCLQLVNVVAHLLLQPPILHQRTRVPQDLDPGVYGLRKHRKFWRRQARRCLASLQG